MPEHQWKGCGWGKTKRLRNASQLVIRATSPVLRIVGYQEHVLRNVQPGQQRAKQVAVASNSRSFLHLQFCVFLLLRAVVRQPARQCNTPTASIQNVLLVPPQLG